MARPQNNDPNDPLDPEDDENELGLDAEGDPAPEAYESESAAPLTSVDREETRDRIAGRAEWTTANETGDPTGNEVENGPDVDPNDPNLSATLAEAGAEDRKNEMGMRDFEEFLDDPETVDAEDE